MKEQFPDKELVAVLELHTFSSLNAEFMDQYNGAMDKADIAIVFYSNHALELKRMKSLDPVLVINEANILEKRLKEIKISNTNFLFMSSGNYDGINILNTLQLY